MSDDHGLARPPAVGGIRRMLYVALGLFFVGLAVLGVVLPVLPTTPFVLLASYFFVRSSPRLHGWLLRSRVFGGLLRDWQRHRAVRPRVKVVAVLVLVAAVAASALFANLPLPALLGLLALGAVGLVVVLRLPVLREPATAAQEEQVAA
jgi:uncharacterized membrane protein YbaN (DUF454 family)